MEQIIVRQVQENRIARITMCTMYFRKQDVIVVCHVDELAIFEKNQIVINKFQKQAKNVLQIKFLGKSIPFLGIELKSLCSTAVDIRQRKIIQNFVMADSMEDCNAIGSPRYIAVKDEELRNAEALSK